MNLDSNAGDKVAEAIDERIVKIAKQVWKGNPSCRWARGKIIAIYGKNHTIKINNAIYTNVKAYKHIGTIDIGDIVDLLIPNNNWSLMIINGILDE